MSDSDTSGREYGRALFVLGCVLALVLAAVLLPVLAAPLQTSPIESLLPTQGSSAGGSGGGLGALNPGESTQVGGLDGSSTSALRSQSAETHFLVQSTEAAYWRTGAYETYTGSGWERSGGSSEYDGSISVDGLSDREVSYQVELKQSATALPTVWQPRTLDTNAPISVTEQRAVSASSAVDAGTTYTATSARPPRDPDVLATADRDYPAAVTDRYTQLPVSTPDRLGRFTDELTSDADSPYETATRIERWLETNKSYSLNVTSPGGDSVASEFVFGMEKGYCEYFATSMVAMLRTQGIPARYVVGYSTGQQTGQNTYTVRGMNAHAWVEVYFSDVGWVRFDPTPGGERLSAEQDALQRQQSDADDYDHTEEGSPGEEFTPNGTSPDEPTTPEPPTTPDDPGDDPGDNPGDDPGDNPGDDSPFDVSLSEQPVPGSDVTVTVERDGTPASGVTVLFNGESIGSTGVNGTVSGRVPYAENLTVTVQATQEGDPALQVGGGSRGDVQYALGQPSLDALYAEETTNRTYDVPTDATLSLSGRVATGQDVVVTATVAGEPVPNAEVAVDGERVGTTDDSGRIELTLPSEPGTATMTVQRGSVTGNRTLELHDLRLDIESQLPVALPWSGVTVTARLGNETVADVPVWLNGERVGTTGIDGSLTVSLPLADSATLSTRAYGQRTSTTVGGLWGNLAGVVGAITVLVVGSVVVARRRGIDPRAVLDRLLAGVLALPRWLLSALIATADALARVGSRAGDSIRRGVAAVRAVLAGEMPPGALLAALRGWLDETAADVRSTIGPWGTQDGSDTDADQPSEAYRTIRAAWEQFLGHVSVREPATKTPGELATHAVERDGLPPEAVTTLRDAFRDVEYGARAPDDRLPEVESATERLEDRGEE